MKKTLLILAIAAMAAFIVGCSQPSEGDTAATGSTATAGASTAGAATAGAATAGTPAATAGTTG